MKFWTTLTLVTSLYIGIIIAQDDMDTPPKKTPEQPADPCKDLKCKTGEMCKINNAGNAACTCIDNCPPEWNNYPRTLCVNNNQTYRHECDLWRNLCYCKSNDQRCGSSDFSGYKTNAGYYIEYYDECRDLGNMCNWNREESTFGLRLGLWFRSLFNTKYSVPSGSRNENIDRNSLLRPLSQKARDRASRIFEGDTSVVSPTVITFWFCEMDTDRDGTLTQRELSSLSRILNPNTPCLNMFLQKCGKPMNPDNWHKCFNVTANPEDACSNYY